MSTDSPSRPTNPFSARRPDSRPRTTGKLADFRRTATFVSAGWRSLRTVGTLLPSGPVVARRLASVIPAPGQPTGPVVVEVGAGTGELTPSIVAKAGAGARVIAVERDPALAAALDRRALGAEVVVADAATLPDLLAERGLRHADAVISALPWAWLNIDQQRLLLRAFHASLHPGGVFTTLAYSSGLWLPSAVSFRRMLGGYFDEVLPTRTVWRNLPPAMTYVCRRPVAVNGREV